MSYDSKEVLGLRGRSYVGLNLYRSRKFWLWLSIRKGEPQLRG
jgi:hypothetical protein